MEKAGYVRPTSTAVRRGHRGRARAVVPVVGQGIQVACDRRPWWRIDRYLSSLSAAAPASRAPAPLLGGLTAQPEPDRPVSWFVGRIPTGKRLLDLVLIVVALPFLIPLFACVAAFIKIVSPGPIFFAQDRMGYREKRFRMFKFRSMKVDAETGAHKNHTTHLFKSDKPMEKMDHVDPRLIPFAWIVRSTGIDELPQLINVLRGEMSLVGPRPCTAYEHEVMLPWHKRRFEVLPGLTGLWQVSGKNKTTFQQMINYDIAYARDWSLWLDLKIIFGTLPVLIGQLQEMINKRRSGGPGAPPASSPEPETA